MNPDRHAASRGMGKSTQWPRKPMEIYACYERDRHMTPLARSIAACVEPLTVASPSSSFLARGQ